MKEAGQLPEEEEALPKASDIVNFAGSCTLHGLSHVFVPGPFTLRRLAWTLALLASVGIFLYQVAERVQYYQEYHHVTMLDEEEGQRLAFPAVTFCNYNRIRRSRLTRNDLHWLGRELLGVEPPQYPDYLRALGWPDPDSNPPGFFPTRTFNMLDFFQRAGHTLEEMLLQCRFRTRECGPENFTSVSPPWLRPCPGPQKPAAATHTTGPPEHSRALQE